MSEIKNNKVEILEDSGLTVTYRPDYDDITIESEDGCFSVTFEKEDFDKIVALMREWEKP